MKYRTPLSDEPLSVDAEIFVASSTAPLEDTAKSQPGLGNWQPGEYTDDKNG
jgi:hypothetical protein